ncbi:MAG: POTRA domain-containing protein [Myxococcaceae bacterium]
MSLLLGGVLAVLALPGAPPPGVEAPTKVNAVEVRLPPGSDPALLKDIPQLVAVGKGRELSLRDVQKSIERLMGTGRFGSVEVRAEPDGDGERIVFLLEPKQVLAEIYFENHLVLNDAELLAASKLAKGNEFYPELVQQATDGILRAYSRKGYRATTVTATVTEGDEGVSLGLRVEEGPPTRLEHVVVSGDAGLTPRQLMEVLQLELGSVLNLDQVDAALARLKDRLKQEHFYRARVDTPETDDSGRLVIPVQAGPRLSIAFKGNRFFGPHALKSVLGYDGSEALDSSLTERLATKLVTFYQYRGFRDARVRWEEKGTPHDAELTFVLDEGPRWVVNQITFEGNAQISQAELKGVLADAVRATSPDPGEDFHPLTDPLQLDGKKHPTPFSNMPSPEPEQVAVDAAYEEAARAMVNLYRERGFTKATVALKELVLEDNGKAHVTFEVQEGLKVSVNDIKVIGAPDKRFPKLDQPYKTGSPYSVRMLERWRQSLINELQHMGYLYATVEAEAAIEGNSAHLLFKCVPNDRVVVGKVLIRGIKRTAEPVVRHAVTLHEGEVLDIDQLFASQRNLLTLGIFNSIDVRLLAPDTAEPVKDVEVVLEERIPIDGEFGLGYFLAEGPRVGVDAQAPNLFGRAINASGRLTLNYFAASAPALSRQVDVSDLAGPELIGGRGNISLSNRGLLPADIGMRVDLLGERLFRQSYRFTRFALVPGLDWSTTNFTVPGFPFAKQKLTLQLQYELEWSRVLPVSSFEGQVLPLVRADQERLRFLFGTFALQTVRFVPTLDLRDDAFTPHKGMLVQGSIESTFDVYTRDQNANFVPVRFLKVTGTVTNYFSIGKSMVLALSARAGKIFPLEAGSVTPPVKRFFMGGASSIRGFPEDGLIAADQRADYARQVNDCRTLASSYGCTNSARTLLAGQSVASQGGELFYLGKAELRFPAFSSFDWGVFFEAGNLWLGPMTSFSFRTVAGVGLRYTTPIGPLALDLGFNLFPDPVLNEGYVQPHFNIGLF